MNNEQYFLCYRLHEYKDSPSEQAAVLRKFIMRQTYWAHWQDGDVWDRRQAASNVLFASKLLRGEGINDWYHPQAYRYPDSRLMQFGDHGEIFSLAM